MDADSLCREAAGRHHRGEFPEAERLYLEVLESAPEHATALRLLGVLRSQQGRKGEALELMRAALAREPGSAPGLLHYAILLHELGRDEEALENFDRAIAANPRSAAAFYNRGNVLGALARHDAALESHGQALALDPDFAEALNNRAGILRRLGRHQEALADYTRAAMLRPHDTAPLANRGKILRELKRPAEAVEVFEEVLAMDAGLAAAWDERGAAFWDMKRLDQALASFDNAIAADLDFAPGHFHKAVTLLLLGRLGEGWPLLEWRRRLPSARPCLVQGPSWTGREDIAGKTLFIWWEEGLGDAIHFARYALLAKAGGARVIFSLPDVLTRLMHRLSEPVEIVGENEVPAQFDYQIPLLSLPCAFATAMDTIPAPVPYLSAEPVKANAWAQRIGSEGFRIGVVWASTTSRSLGRSFPLHALEGIARLPGVRLISLQKGDGLEELDTLPPGMTVERLEPFDQGDAFADSAAIMQSLDLVITADTAAAHLAGALGRPVWLALKFAADWRWFLDRADSPWYPTARLFRQAGDDDWTSVFEAMRTELAPRLS